MRRAVRGADGRNWVIQSTINWSQPATAEQFEHDMADGYVAAIVIVGVVVALSLFVVFWTPAGVVVPSWLVLLFLLALLVLPIQWALRRPWTIVAKTSEPVGSAGEHWVGTVHGLMAARQDTRGIVKCLKSQQAIPDNGTGTLRQVT
ncbi:MAG: DUF983 domain-containing protein [Actinomycetota bacterium]|nr:DUF983 domain-containing protein [Actinomycetota bacterium]